MNEIKPKNKLIFIFYDSFSVTIQAVTMMLYLILLKMSTHTNLPLGWLQLLRQLLLQRPLQSWLQVELELVLLQLPGAERLPPGC